MEDTKLEKLNKLIELLKTDTVTPKELEQFLIMVLNVIKVSKDNFEKMSADRIESINIAFSEIKKQQELIAEESLMKSKNMTDNIFLKIQEIQSLLQEVKSIKATPGKDGVSPKMEDIVQEVLKNMEPTDPTEEETPEQTRDKLEILEGDERLDESAVKGIDEKIQKAIDSVKSLFTSRRNTIGGGVTQIKAGTGVTISSSGANGRGVVTINSNATGGGFSIETPVGTINSSNVTFTVSNTPKAVVLNGLMYFQNDGYTLSGLTITMLVIPMTGSTLRSLY